MEQLKEFETIQELLQTQQYTRLRQLLVDLNDADIAAYMEELPEQSMVKAFRILPKDLAADIFSYLEVDRQQTVITSLTDREAANIIDNLMADDAVDLLEEMPANVVKRLLENASPETRRDINHLLRYPEDSAGSIMTVEYVDLKERQQNHNPHRRECSSGHTGGGIRTLSWSNADQGRAFPIAFAGHDPEKIHPGALPGGWSAGFLYIRLCFPYSGRSALPPAGESHPCSSHRQILSLKSSSDAGPDNRSLPDRLPPLPYRRDKNLLPLENLFWPEPFARMAWGR